MADINDRAVAIVYKDNQILMMWRHRNGEEYHTFPGGTQEERETIEETLVREVYEELNLKVKNYKKAFEWVHEYDTEDQHFSRREFYFLISDYEGEIKLGAPELFKQNKDNIYRPDWIDLDKVDQIDYEPREIFEIIKKEVKAV